MRKYVFVGPNGDLWPQVAAALFNQLADSRAAYAVAVGLDPAPVVHPSAVRLLEEKGVRLPPNAPFRFTPGIARGAEAILVFGCGPDIGAAPGVRRLDWETPRSKEEPLEQLRAWRDEVYARIVVAGK